MKEDTWEPIGGVYDDDHLDESGESGDESEEEEDGEREKGKGQGKGKGKSKRADEDDEEEVSRPRKRRGGQRKQAETTRNSGYSNSHSKYTGVNRLPNGMFRCRIYKGSLTIEIGLFPTAEDAARAYNVRAKKLGKKLNLIVDDDGEEEEDEEEDKMEEVEEVEEGKEADESDMGVVEIEGDDEEEEEHEEGAADGMDEEGGEEAPSSMDAVAGGGGGGGGADTDTDADTDDGGSGDDGTRVEEPAKKRRKGLATGEAKVAATKAKTGTSATKSVKAIVLPPRPDTSNLVSQCTRVNVVCLGVGRGGRGGRATTYAAGCMRLTALPRHHRAIISPLPRHLSLAYCTYMYTTNSPSTGSSSTNTPWVRTTMRITRPARPTGTRVGRSSSRSRCGSHNGSQAWRTRCSVRPSVRVRVSTGQSARRPAAVS